MSAVGLVVDDSSSPSAEKLSLDLMVRTILHHYNTPSNKSEKYSVDHLRRVLRGGFWTRLRQHRRWQLEWKTASWRDNVKHLSWVNPPKDLEAAITLGEEYIHRRVHGQACRKWIEELKQEFGGLACAQSKSCQSSGTESPDSIHSCFADFNDSLQEIHSVLSSLDSGTQRLEYCNEQVLVFDQKIQ